MAGNQKVARPEDKQEDEDRSNVKQEDKPILCCGLVCLDVVTVVDVYPTGSRPAHF
jgi:hypothetical protein